MNRVDGRIFWTVIVLGVGFLLWLLSPVLLPFVLGMAIAYFLDPAVDFLERRRLSRALGTAIVILVFFAIIVVAFVLIVPLVEGQIAGLASRLPTLYDQMHTKLDALLVRLQVQSGIPIGDVRSLKEAAQGQVSQVATWAGGLLSRVVQGGLALVNILSLIFVTPVVAFYLLRDWDRMMIRVDSWLPRAHAASIRAQTRQIDRALSGFARGQALLSLALMIYYGVALTIVGLDFGLIVGLVTGVLSFIPFVGFITGLIVSVILAAVQFENLSGVLWVGGVFLAGQLLEASFLQPKLVGDRVGLHPVWIIFALLAGGALFGFVGILISVPVTAAIGVIARFMLGRYLASPLYEPSVAEAAIVRETEYIRASEPT